MADTEIMTAELITAPVIEAVLLGEKHELRFDNRAAMMAERYWRETTGQRVSWFFILGELNARTYGGTMAAAYGGLASATMHRNLSRKRPEQVISCRAFEEGASMNEILACMEDVRQAVEESLPREPKNVGSPGKTGAKDGPGMPSQEGPSGQDSSGRPSGS